MGHKRLNGRIPKEGQRVAEREDGWYIYRTSQDAGRVVFKVIHRRNNRRHYQVPRYNFWVQVNVKTGILYRSKDVQYLSENHPAVLTWALAEIAGHEGTAPDGFSLSDGEGGRRPGIKPDYYARILGEHGADWILYLLSVKVREDDGTVYYNYKLVARTGQPYKGNYWLSYVPFSDTLVESNDLEQLRRHRPELYAWFLGFLPTREDTADDINDLLA